jgi:N-hydroxyarylamine O-acetyltransferase
MLLDYGEEPWFFPLRLAAPGFVPYDGSMEGLLDEYLNRIGLPRLPAANESGLHELHTAQIFTLPFENLSVFLGEPVELEPEALVAKMVRRKRGGYCFELNGLFAWVMRAAGLGFDVHLARVQAHNPEPGALTHQLSLVKIGSRTWLCDVGFGGPGIRYPMPYELDRVETQDGEEFRLRAHPDFGHTLEQKQADGSWMPLYHFHRAPVLALDIAMGNHFTSTWQQSIFRRTLMLSRPFPGGKSTLFGRDFKRREGGATTARRVADSRELLELLGSEIGLELSGPQKQGVADAFARLG